MCVSALTCETKVAGRKQTVQVWKAKIKNLNVQVCKTTDTDTKLLRDTFLNILDSKLNRDQKQNKKTLDLLKTNK